MARMQDTRVINGTTCGLPETVAALEIKIMAKRIITEADILEANARGEKSLAVTPGLDLITAQARDTAQALGLKLSEDACVESSSDCAIPGNTNSPQGTGATTAGETGALHSRLARQIAESLRGKIPPGADHSRVERLVREAIAVRTAAADSSLARSGGARDCGVCFVEGSRVLAQRVPSPGGVEKVMLAEVFGNSADSRLSAGYLTWERTSFNRVVEAPEVCVIIEGELHLTAGGETLIGKPGDMFYLPQGAKLVYSTPSRVKLACVGRPE
jgi:ethanolamine utilization protein EutQ